MPGVVQLRRVLEQMAVASSQIKLAHGGGGRLTDRLVKDLILKHLPHQPTLLDAATVETPDSAIAFTTDSYVVSPIFFPGGDLGKLAVFGTCNDLAVAGAKPVALSLALIIEEGLELDTLERLVQSIGLACRESGVKVVTGDTKVVRRGQADGIYINTAGVGYIWQQARLGFELIEPADLILLSGPIGDHGLAIMAQREGLRFQTPIASDTTNLADLAGDLVAELGSGVKFMRDPTRGGLAGVLVDIADNAARDVMIYESQIPTHPTGRAAAEVLGLDLLTVANEGKLAAVIEPSCGDKALDVCRRFEKSAQAALVGEIGDARSPGRVVMTTLAGGRRIVQKPYGEQLPRIC